MTSASSASTPIPAFRVDGKVALVTGAGRGIGAAIARGLAGAGATVVLVSRTTSNLHTVAAHIERAGGHALIRTCDVTDSDAASALIGALPVLDILVNNAGEEDAGAFVDVSDARLDAMLALNVRAAFLVAQAAVRKMLQRDDGDNRGGVVINISSQHGLVGASERAVYCMTKHAIEGLSKAMAVELAPHGIRVNSIGPTFVDKSAKQVRDAGHDDRQHRLAVERIPMGRMADVNDVAAAAIFLASPVSAMVTGTCLLVDGGWTAQ